MTPAAGLSLSRTLAPCKRATRAYGAAMAACAASLVLAAPADATFAGRDGLIAFSRYTSETRASSLWVVRPDGTRARRLPWSRGTRNWGDSEPQWSPDGRALAFTHSSGNVRFYLKPQVMVARPWWAKPRFVAYGRTPTWSPDGRALAFVTYKRWEEQDEFGSTRFHESWHIDTKPVAGGKKRRLTTWEEVSLDGLSWSPDGSRIAFDENSGNTTGADRDIYTVSVADRTEAPLVQGIDHYANPDWHPAGSQVAFECEWNTTWDEICLFDPNTPGDDGLGIQYLIRDGDEDADDYDPAWSPSGRHIVWSRNLNLHTMRPDGTRRRRVTRGKALDLEPNWQPRPRAKRRADS